MSNYKSYLVTFFIALAGLTIFFWNDKATIFLQKNLFDQKVFIIGGASINLKEDWLLYYYRNKSLPGGVFLGVIPVNVYKKFSEKEILSVKIIDKNSFILFFEMRQEDIDRNYRIIANKEKLSEYNEQYKDDTIRLEDFLGYEALISDRDNVVHIPNLKLTIYMPDGFKLSDLATIVNNK